MTVKSKMLPQVARWRAMALSNSCELKSGISVCKPSLSFIFPLRLNIPPVLELNYDRAFQCLYLTDELCF